MEEVIRGMAMHYFSTVHGFAEDLLGKDTVYHGMMFRIPRRAFTNEEHRALEGEKVDELRRRIEEHIQQAWGKGDPVILCEPLERYEVYDFETGDVWVMYRVPFQLVAD